MSITLEAKLDLTRDASFGTDISPYVLEARVTQGRRKSLDPMEPAKAIVKLNNADGRFSPRNSSGPYYPDFDERNRGIRIYAGHANRCFTGYITRIKQDPYAGSREVVLECVDRLGLAARAQLLKAGKFRQQAVYKILNRLLDLLERGEEVTNPGGENGSTTGYTALDAGTSLSAPMTDAFEGDYCIQAVCDGSASGQGWRYDFGSVLGTYRRLAIAARTAPGNGSATLTLRGLDASLVQKWTTTIDVVDDAWTVWRDSYGSGRSAHRYVELKTGSAVALTILSDCFHQVPIQYGINRGANGDTISSYLDAVAQLVAFYDEPALAALERLVATEAAGFLWMGNMVTAYGNVLGSCQGHRDTLTSPLATFADDGTGVRYVGLEFERDGAEMISEARVESEGDYSDGEDETTIWELSPLPLVVPASTTVTLSVEYPSPARDCRLELATDKGQPFKVAAAANDGMISTYGLSYPPGTAVVETAGNNTDAGQRKLGLLYYVQRSYFRFDTSGIPDGDTISKVTLRLKLTANYTGQSWTLEVRQPGGSSYDWGTLDTGDWSANPGNDTLIGSVASSDFPPVGQWLEIELNTAAINKSGWTAFYLISDRDRLGNAPTGSNEAASFRAYGDGVDVAELVVAYSSLSLSSAFRNYGAGADVDLTAGGLPITVNGVTVKGVPYSQGSERSLVAVVATDPAPVPNPLSVEMPYQGTRTAEMKTEAQRLADRYDAGAYVDRVKLSLEEQDADTLTQMQQRSINDLVTVKNVQFDYSSKLNGNFFIEGIDWQVTDQGKVLAVQFYLEQK